MKFHTQGHSEICATGDGGSTRGRTRRHVVRRRIEVAVLSVVTMGGGGYVVSGHLAGAVTPASLVATGTATSRLPLTTVPTTHDTRTHARLATLRRDAAAPSTTSTPRPATTTHSAHAGVTSRTVVHRPASPSSPTAHVVTVTRRPTPVTTTTLTPSVTRRPAPVTTTTVTRTVARRPVPAVTRTVTRKPVTRTPVTRTRTVSRTTTARPTTKRPAPPRRPAPVRAKLLTALNPASNIAPNPDFLQSGPCSQSGGAWSCANPCVTSSMAWPTVSTGAGCTNYILQAIDAARTVEGIGPMVLPSNWATLTIPEQLFVVANLERTARGLPPYLGLNATLSAEAQHAAATNSDPGLAPGFATGTDPQGYPGMGGAWSAGFSVLAADYLWMYADGWGGSAADTSNVACTSAGAAACWAHRDELLGYDPSYNPGVGLSCTDCEMGTGFAVLGRSGSFVDLVEQPAGAPPAMTFTWAQDVAPYL